MNEPSDSQSVAANTYLRIDFRAHPDVAAKTRNYLHDLYRDLLSSDELAARAAIVAYELVENLVKYSSATSTMEATLHISGAQARIHIRTRNRSHLVTLQQLGRTLDEIINASEPIRTYDDAIVRCEKSQESRLGLARIRAEAEMQLAYSIAGDEVTIDAEWSGAY